MSFNDFLNSTGATGTAATERTALGLTASTQGALVFINASGQYVEDSTYLFYNGTTHRLGLGTNTPSYREDIQGTIRNIYGTNSEFATLGTATLTGNNGFVVRVQGKFAYVTDLAGAVFSVVDISNPSAPAEVGSVTLAGQLRGVAVQGPYAYVAAAAGTSLLYVIDISNPKAPTSVGSVAITDARAVSVSGKYAYVFLNNGASSSVKIVDVSVPTAPTIVGTATMDQGVCGQMAVQGKYLYVGASTNSTISIFDISDPTNPTLVSGRYNTGGTFSLEVSGRYLYTINTSGRLAIVDVSDPTTPTTVATSTSFNGNGGLRLAGRYLYMVSSSFNLIRVIDVQDPTTPTQVATFAIAASASNLDIAGKYAYVTFSTNPDKLIVYDLSGIETSSFKSASAAVGRLQVTESLSVAGNAVVDTGLTVGQEGVYTKGPLATQDFTTLGTSFGIKTKVITGTTSNSQGNQVQVAHGISDPSKIISISTLVDIGSSIYIAPAYAYSAGYQYDHRVGGTDIYVSNVTGNSANILSMPFKTFIIYRN